MRLYITLVTSASTDYETVQYARTDSAPGVGRCPAVPFDSILRRHGGGCGRAAVHITVYAAVGARLLRLLLHVVAPAPDAVAGLHVRVEQRDTRVHAAAQPARGGAAVYLQMGLVREQVPVRAVTLGAPPVARQRRRATARTRRRRCGQTETGGQHSGGGGGGGA